MSKLTIVHWMTLQRILRYLWSNPESGLRIRKIVNNDLVGFSDANWADDEIDRRSQGGHFIFWGGNLISWSSHKQPTVTRSSTEAEYRSLADATSDINCIETVLGELGIKTNQPATIWCDNIAAIYLTKNLIHHVKTKHVVVHYHFVKEQISSDRLEAKYVYSKDQIADILTRPLMRSSFTYLCDKLMERAPIRLRGVLADRSIKVVNKIN